MVLGLFVWIIFAIVIPNVSVQLATDLRPFESQDKRDSRMVSLKKDLANELGNIKMDSSNWLITSVRVILLGGTMPREGTSIGSTLNKNIAL